jgi:hypothetical protein
LGFSHQLSNLSQKSLDEKTALKMTKTGTKALFTTAATKTTV